MKLMLKLTTASQRGFLVGAAIAAGPTRPKYGVLPGPQMLLPLFSKALLNRRVKSQSGFAPATR